jgi:hypothetical protein
MCVEHSFSNSVFSKDLLYLNFININICRNFCHSDMHRAVLLLGISEVLKVALRLVCKCLTFFWHALCFVWHYVFDV